MTETLTPNQKKKKNRPHKRRPKYILQDYARRQKEHKWLETHIWHAKRMKMTALWGYKIVK
jgi:ribonuclease P/MRP protein subunit POP1